jgi:hypothetical protein
MSRPLGPSGGQGGVLTRGLAVQAGIPQRDDRGGGGGAVEKWTSARRAAGKQIRVENNGPWTAYFDLADRPKQVRLSTLAPPAAHPGRGVCGCPFDSQGPGIATLTLPLSCAIKPAD